jgi:Secretion system C-terminal sorting domain
MKNFFTPLYYAKVLAFSLFFCLPMVATAQVLLTQSFGTTATPVSSYVGTGANQFDFIQTSGTSSIYIASGTDRLQFQRGAAAAALVKSTTDFVTVPTPNVLKVNFSLTVPFLSSTTATAAALYVGSGLAAAATGNEAALSHSRLEIAFDYSVTTAPVFRLKNGSITSGNYAANSTNTLAVTWYINNSGATISYKNPTVGSTSLPNNTADVWVGSTLTLTNIPAATANVALTDFKFLFSAGTGAIGLDDIVISTGPNVLPVTLTSFTANKAEATNQLTWVTASEQNASHYSVERSLDAQNFVEIGKVSAQGKAATYNFADDAPLSISYYRLRQVDFDGTETLSKVVSVSQDTKGRISITPNPTSDKVNINLNQNEVSNQTAKVVLSDMTGRQILTQNTTSGALELDLSNLAKGMYVLTVQSNNAIYQEKIIRQ